MYVLCRILIVNKDNVGSGTYRLRDYILEIDFSIYFSIPKKTQNTQVEVI